MNRYIDWPRQRIYLLRSSGWQDCKPSKTATQCSKQALVGYFRTLGHPLPQIYFDLSWNISGDGEILLIEYRTQHGGCS